jgi:hypothetical protein
MLTFRPPPTTRALDRGHGGDQQLVIAFHHVVDDGHRRAILLAVVTEHAGPVAADELATLLLVHCRSPRCAETSAAPAVAPRAVPGPWAAAAPWSRQAATASASHGGRPPRQSRPKRAPRAALRRRDAHLPRHASGARGGQTRWSQVALNGSEDAHRLGRNPCKIGASASFVALATLLWSGLSRITPPGERSAARTAGSTASAAAVTAQFHAAMRSRPPLFGSGVRRDDPPETVIPVDGRLQATRTAATPWKGWWPILGRHALARLFRHVE